MDTVHTYIIGKEDDIKRVLSLCLSRGGSQKQNGQATGVAKEDVEPTGRREELFNISLALYQDNREYVIGNSHLPIEDLMETIQQHEDKVGSYNKKTKKTTLTRTLFVYGTTYSQRENCIIGKLQLEVVYNAEKLFLSRREAKIYKE
mmetsp:Transcript_34710/g.53250  ORF Transcript_34710/g.53250 Transcript_34710/m.53250 type:complete len:147 (+) Transcript_34710:4399-4839(+)